MSDLVGNPEDGFSRVKAQIKPMFGCLINLPDIGYTNENAHHVT